MTTCCIIATPSPVFLFKHVKHGTENIQNDGLLAALECVEFVFGCCSAPDLAGGRGLQRSPDLLAGLRGLLLRGGKGKSKLRGRGNEGKGKEETAPLRKFLDPPLTTNA